jgi:hypothetical protein
MKLCRYGACITVKLPDQAVVFAAKGGDLTLWPGNEMHSACETSELRARLAAALAQAAACAHFQQLGSLRSTDSGDFVLDVSDDQ